MARCAGCGEEFEAGQRAIEAAVEYLYCFNCVMEVTVMGQHETQPLLAFAHSLN